MGKQDIINDFKNQKILGMDINDKVKIEIANKAISNINKENKEVAKKNLPIDNKYKNYVITNMKITDETNSQEIEVDTVVEAIEKMHQVDFRYIFGIDAEIEEIFINDLYCSSGSISFVSKSKEEAQEKIEKEYSNINYNETGYYRMGYFVTNIVVRDEKSFSVIVYDKVRKKFIYKIKKDNSPSKYNYETAFDIIDFYEIIMHCDTITAIKELSRILKIRIREVKHIEDKYQKNIVFIKNELKKCIYPNLYNLLGEHIPKLLALLEEGDSKSFRHYKIGEKSCFSCSLSYLAEKVGKKKNTLCPIMNTFILLGFAEKISNVDGKRKIKDIGKKDISYYSIMEYTVEEMEKAESIAKVLLENGVSASKLKYKNCSLLFGEEITDNIYIADLNRR